MKRLAFCFLSYSSIGLDKCRNSYQRISVFSERIVGCRGFRSRAPCDGAQREAQLQTAAEGSDLLAVALSYFLVFFRGLKCELLLCVLEFIDDAYDEGTLHFRLFLYLLFVPCLCHLCFLRQSRFLLPFHTLLPALLF